MRQILARELVGRIRDIQLRFIAGHTNPPALGGVLDRVGEQITDDHPQQRRIGLPLPGHVDGHVELPAPRPVGQR
jgi:hypothetical protein